MTRRVCKTFTTITTVFVSFFFCGTLSIAIVGCVPMPKSHSHHSRRSSRPQARPVDTRAQQRYYDLGLQQYSKERYREAKKSFRRVVEFGPHTELGGKARENLKKIDQILKTLEDMESK